MQLEYSEIHLWAADQADFDLAQLESLCLGWFGKEDLQRYYRLVFARHRKQMLLGRYLLRSTLSHYADSVALSEWRFTHNAYGKPALDTAVHKQGLFFNLSHSQGKIVLALARHDFVGVDIEEAARPRRIGRIAQRYFSPSEVSALLGLSAHLQLSRFYQLWTLKESYIKACGMGLAIPLNQFSFSFHDNTRISVQFDAELPDEPMAWHFWEIETATTFQLSLALKLKDAVQPIRVRMGYVGAGGFEQGPELADATIAGSSLSA